MQFHKQHHLPSVGKIIKASLEYDEPVGSKCVQLALLKGLLYILEAQLTKVIHFGWLILSVNISSYGKLI